MIDEPIYETCGAAAEDEGHLFWEYQNGSKDDHKEARAEHETVELDLSKEQSTA